LTAGLLGLLLWLAGAVPAMAQGAGANTNILTPVGMQTLTFNAQDINSNFRFGQTLIGEAKFDTNSLALNYAHRFQGLGRFAMLGLGASYLSIDAHLHARSATGPDATRSAVVRQSGMGDPSAFLRFGLVGAPALRFESWRDFEHGFQMYAQAGVQAPWGSYDASRLLNTGYNRWSWDLSLPMAMPLEHTRRRTFLEITPRLVWFGDNDDPAGAASVKSQRHLLLLEADVLHHLTGRVWTALGMQYQKGGETVTDSFPDGNEIEQWYGELTFGYAINSRLAMNFKWGKLFEVSNDARGDVLRFTLVYIL
jgi:hypothetical protein